MDSLFRTIAHRTSAIMGSSKAFAVALSVVLCWALSGYFFDYSDTWQLVINTGTTIVTFLMVFLIQNAQNKDAKALHLKLDEIIAAINEADDTAIDLENSTEEEMELLHQKLLEWKHQRLSGRE